MSHTRLHFRKTYHQFPRLLGLLLVATSASSTSPWLSAMSVFTVQGSERPRSMTNFCPHTVTQTLHNSGREICS